MDSTALDIALERRPAGEGFTRYRVLYRSAYGVIPIAMTTLPNAATAPTVEDALLLLGNAIADAMNVTAPVRHLELLP